MRILGGLYPNTLYCNDGLLSDAQMDRGLHDALLIDLHDLKLCMTDG